MIRSKIQNLIYVSAGVLFILGSAAFYSNKSTVPQVKAIPSFSNNIDKPAEVKKTKEVTRLDLPPDRTVLVYGEIDNSEVVTQRLLDLGQSDEPIYLSLNSPGGSVLDGAMIISAMEAAKGPVYTICDTLCASMAAMIFEHGTGRYMVDRSFVMFHPASGGMQGEVDKMASRIASIQKFMGKMEAYVAQRANITFERYKQLSGIELWLDSEDAVNGGFADALVSFVYPVGVLPSANSITNHHNNNKIPGFTLEPMKREVSIKWGI